MTSLGRSPAADSSQPPVRWRTWQLAAAIGIAYLLGVGAFHWAYLIPVFWMLAHTQHSLLCEVWDKLRRDARTDAMCNADAEPIHWLNHTAQHLWNMYEPGIANYFRDLLSPFIYDAIRSTVPFDLVQLKLARLSFGKVRPHDSRDSPLHLENAKIVSRTQSADQERNSVKVRTDIHFACEQAALIEVKGVVNFEIEVREVKLEGVLLIDLEFRKAYPYLSLVALSFESAPSTSYKISVLNLIELTALVPPIKQKLQDLLDYAIREYLVKSSYKIPLFDWYGVKPEAPIPAPQSASRRRSAVSRRPGRGTATPGSYQDVPRARRRYSLQHQNSCEISSPRPLSPDGFEVAAMSPRQRTARAAADGGYGGGGGGSGAGHSGGGNDGGGCGGKPNGRVRELGKGAAADASGQNDAGDSGAGSIRGKHSRGGSAADVKHMTFDEFFVDEVVVPAYGSSSSLVFDEIEAKSAPVAGTQDGGGRGRHSGAAVSPYSCRRFGGARGGVGGENGVEGAGVTTDCEPACSFDDFLNPRKGGRGGSVSLSGGEGGGVGGGGGAAAAVGVGTGAGAWAGAEGGDSTTVSNGTLASAAMDAGKAGAGKGLEAGACALFGSKRTEGSGVVCVGSRLGDGARGRTSSGVSGGGSLLSGLRVPDDAVHERSRFRPLSLALPRTPNTPISPHATSPSPSPRQNAAAPLLAAGTVPSNGPTRPSPPGSGAHVMTASEFFCDAEFSNEFSQPRSLDEACGSSFGSLPGLENNGRLSNYGGGSSSGDFGYCGHRSGGGGNGGGGGSGGSAGAGGGSGGVGGGGDVGGGGGAIASQPVGRSESGSVSGCRDGEGEGQRACNFVSRARSGFFERAFSAVASPPTLFSPRPPLSAARAPELLEPIPYSLLTKSLSEEQRPKVLGAAQLEGAVGTLHVGVLTVTDVVPRERVAVAVKSLSPDVIIELSLGDPKRGLCVQGKPATVAAARQTAAGVHLELMQAFRLHVHDTLTQGLRVRVLLREPLQDPAPLATAELPLHSLQMDVPSRLKLKLDHVGRAAGKPHVQVDMQLTYQSTS